jgi:hypothetical protein
MSENILMTIPKEIMILIMRKLTLIDLSFLELTSKQMMLITVKFLENINKPVKKLDNALYVIKLHHWTLHAVYIHTRRWFGNDPSLPISLKMYKEPGIKMIKRGRRKIAHYYDIDNDFHPDTCFIFHPDTCFIFHPDTCFIFHPDTCFAEQKSASVKGAPQKSASVKGAPQKSGRMKEEKKTGKKVALLPKPYPILCE